MVIDISLIVVWGLVTWCVSREGAFGAALNCLAIVIGGLMAMNFFEPVANFGERYLLSGPNWSYYWDVIALVGLFAAAVTALRMTFDYFSIHRFELAGISEEIGRWSFGAVGGYTTMAFLLTALHTAPLPREFLGFTPERKNLFNVVAPDRQWLGLTQFVSENVFASSDRRVFDGPVSDFIQNPGDANRNTVWPSFPIRYATRRDQYSGVVTITAPTPAPAPAPAPATSQSSPPAKNAGGF